MSAMAVPTVLTVEDDPIIRADLRLVLEGAGFEVTAARDGIQAIEMARDGEPDAILLDLSLPRLGGVEVTRQILSERSVPIVALTGRSRGLAEEAIEAGAASYVLKPFHPEEVVGALLTAISEHGDAASMQGRAPSPCAPSPSSGACSATHPNGRSGSRSRRIATASCGGGRADRHDVAFRRARGWEERLDVDRSPVAGKPAAGKTSRWPMSTKPGEPDPIETCAVCGASVEGGSIEDSSGWRWFSDGRGGLLSLCAACPVPDGITEPV